MLFASVFAIACLASSEPLGVTPLAVIGRDVFIAGEPWRLEELTDSSASDGVSAVIMGRFARPGRGTAQAAIFSRDGVSRSIVSVGDVIPTLPTGVATVGAVISAVASPTGEAVAFVNAGDRACVIHVASNGRVSPLLVQGEHSQGVPEGKTFGDLNVREPFYASSSGAFAWQGTIPGTPGNGSAVWCWDAAHGTRLVAIAGVPIGDRPDIPSDVRLRGLSAHNDVLVAATNSSQDGLFFYGVWRNGVMMAPGPVGGLVSADRPDRPGLVITNSPVSVSLGADGTACYFAGARPAHDPHAEALSVLVLEGPESRTLLTHVGAPAPGMRPNVIISRFTHAYATDDGRASVGFSMSGPGIGVNFTSSGVWGKDGYLPLAQVGQRFWQPCRPELEVQGTVLMSVATGSVDLVPHGSRGSGSTDLVDLYLHDRGPIGLRRGLLTGERVMVNGGALTVDVLRTVSAGSYRQPLFSDDRRVVLRLTLSDGSTGLYTTDPIPYPGRAYADVNDDAIIDFFDYDQFVAWLEIGDERADFNADRFLDFFDYFEFVDAYESGC